MNTNLGEGWQDRKPSQVRAIDTSTKAAFFVIYEMSLSETEACTVRMIEKSSVAQAGVRSACMELVFDIIWAAQPQLAKLGLVSWFYVCLSDRCTRSELLASLHGSAHTHDKKTGG